MLAQTDQGLPATAAAQVIPRPTVAMKTSHFIANSNSLMVTDLLMENASEKQLLDTYQISRGALQVDWTPVET